MPFWVKGQRQPFKPQPCTHQYSLPLRPLDFGVPCCAHTGCKESGNCNAVKMLIFEHPVLASCGKKVSSIHHSSQEKYSPYQGEAHVDTIQNPDPWPSLSAVAWGLLRPISQDVFKKSNPSEQEVEKHVPEKNHRSPSNVVHPSFLVSFLTCRCCRP